MERDSVAATVYEFWMLKLTPLVYAPRVPEAARASFRQYDIGQVIGWMKAPDAAYGANGRARTEARDKMLLDALGQGLAEIRKRFGTDPAKWKWGDVHTADFVHPLATTPDTKRLFQVDPVRRGGDGYTVMAATSASETGNKQLSGASFSFVFDVKDWDRSTGLSVPGNSAQPGSPHYSDLASYWGEGKYFPLAYSRTSVDEHAKSRLMLEPLRIPAVDDPATAPRFALVQPDLFAASGGQCSAWGDVDNDGDLDLFVGFRRGRPQQALPERRRHLRRRSPRLRAWPTRKTPGHAAGATSTRTATWISTSASRAPRRCPTSCTATTGNGKHFTDVARAVGVDAVGESRQIAFVDFDSDGQMDLFVAFRDKPNMLFHNEKAARSRTSRRRWASPTRARRSGPSGSTWTRTATSTSSSRTRTATPTASSATTAPHSSTSRHDLGMDGAGRPAVYGSVGPSLADYDNDGRLDLFVAGYGPNALCHNEGGGKFTDIAAKMGVAGDHHARRVELGRLRQRRPPGSLRGRLPDRDRALTATTCTTTTGRRSPRSTRRRSSNTTPRTAYSGRTSTRTARSTCRLPITGRGEGTSSSATCCRRTARSSHSRSWCSTTRAGSRWRGRKCGVYAAGTRTLLGTRIVDTGSGYCSQNAMPVHVGLPGSPKVDVEVTTMTPAGRQLLRTPNVDPAAVARKVLVVRAGR